MKQSDITKHHVHYYAESRGNGLAVLMEDTVMNGEVRHTRTMTDPMPIEDVRALRPCNKKYPLWVVAAATARRARERASSTEQASDDSR